MRQPFIRSLVAWLCLFAFGLDMAVHAIGPVVCLSEGSVRFEWSCEEDDRGVCLATRHGADASGNHARDGRDRCPDQPAPCKDLPVDDDHGQAHHLLVQAKQNGHADFTLPPVQFTVLPMPTFDPPVRLARAGPDAGGRGAWGGGACPECGTRA